MILELSDLLEPRESRVSLASPVDLASEEPPGTLDKLDRTVPEDLRDPREIWDPRDLRVRQGCPEPPELRERGEWQVEMERREMLVSLVLADKDSPEPLVTRAVLERLDPRERLVEPDRMEGLDPLETLDSPDLRGPLECLVSVEER